MKDEHCINNTFFRKSYDRLPDKERGVNRGIRDIRSPTPVLNKINGAADNAFILRIPPSNALPGGMERRAVSISISPVLCIRNTSLIVPTPEVGDPAPTPEVDDPAPTPEVDDPAPTPEVDDPAPTPEVDDPAPTPEVDDPAPTPEVDDPAPTPEVDDPAPTPEVDDPAPTPKDDDLESS
nr:classical arabinogalactan protein 9-like [Procambarus clarkii]